MPPHVISRHLFQGISWFSLRSQTLPPATHTNAWLLGNEERLLIDPGCSDALQQSQIIRWLDEHQHQPRFHLKAILLTHHHPDHVGGARAVSEAMGVPVWAHHETALALPHVVVHRELEDGDVIDLVGHRAQHWRVLHTPGHAPGHICLHEPSLQALVLGDMAAGAGTILISRQDGGDMATYLRQLERLEQLPSLVGLPGHGPVLEALAEKLRVLRLHRLQRESAILDVFHEHTGEVELVDLLPRVYSDISRAAWPLAVQSLQAHLHKLEREGRIEALGGDKFRWCSSGEKLP